ncbi:MAG: FAD-dependent thymidylate synthase [Candidatus Methanomethylophilaceae archaeon]|nr:FAD-dependent thymidylate synthase [Candidatus Methanomethylophilaceae archaeon]
MRVKLLAYTQNADAICAAAGRSCYSEKSSMELVESMKDPQKTLGKIVGMGHHSVIEHAVFTFSVEGVSRSLTHQLVRHRVASYSQQSQRYVSMDKPTYVIPKTVEADPELKKVYEDTMKDIWESYNKLVEKIPPEDARYVLPNGCTTNITITMNARELFHFFTLRCCNRAQWEIRDLADEMLRECKRVSPIIFANAGPPCVRGPCPEGKLTCGKPRKNDFD